MTSEFKVGDLVQFAHKRYMPYDFGNRYGDHEEFVISERVKNKNGEYQYLIKLLKEDRTKIVRYLSVWELTLSDSQVIKENREIKLEDLLR